MSNETPTAEVTGPIIARAGTYYRNARYIMFVIIVAMGVWFIYDGLVKYPAENAVFEQYSAKIDEMNRNPKDRDEAEFLRYTTQRKAMTHHDTFSIRLQKILGFSLPPVAIGLLSYWLRKCAARFGLRIACSPRLGSRPSRWTASTNWTKACGRRRASRTSSTACPTMSPES